MFKKKQRCNNLFSQNAGCLSASRTRILFIISTVMNIECLRNYQQNNFAFHKTVTSKNYNMYSTFNSKDQ